MLGDKNSSNNKLDEQLKITTDCHVVYDEQLMILKEIFYDTYEKSIVIGVLGIIKKLGHTVDQKQAEKFISQYEADNLDESQIKWFKKVYSRYNEPLIEFLNKEEEKE